MCSSYFNLKNMGVQVFKIKEIKNMCIYIATINTNKSLSALETKHFGKNKIVEGTE